MAYHDLKVTDSLFMDAAALGRGMLRRIHMQALFEESGKSLTNQLERSEEGATRHTETR